MFERRIKFLLMVLLLILGLVGVRAFQLQVVQHRDWTEKAKLSLKRQQLLDTVRGSILDARGRAIALDVACIDACVDYRVIQDPPDEKFIRDEARRRLRGTLSGLTKDQRAEQFEQAKRQVRADVEELWKVLGEMPGSSPESVEETRAAITRRVEMRRKILLYSSYQQAVQERQSAPKPPWYRRWLTGDGTDLPTPEQFTADVSEQFEAHPVLRNISAEVNNYLAKNQERLPGLVLKPGITRSYPFGEAGAHLMGHLGRVTREDLQKDDQEDELRQYLPFDLVGKSGLEGLLEARLRGTRGRRVQVFSGDTAENEVQITEPVKGDDVQTTIDIALQGKIQDLFARARLDLGGGKYEISPMHGAAVVIDVPTGEVRAMASYPAFDPNTFDADYRRLADDEINLPLLNRATQAMLEPGSTVKPLVGLAAITAGKLGLYETVTCHGYLVLNGKQYKVGRCWTMTMFQTDHRAVPSSDPHPTGEISFPDAVQRSCNVYFETCGDRLGIAGLTEWMGKFGLGRPTGVGVPEAAGRLPGQFPIPPYLTKVTSWFGGIGQGKVAATPIQMANVAATIARDGIWMRPRLVPADVPLPVSVKDDGRPDRIDLGLNPAAVKLAKEGMVRVVNTPAGSGTKMKRDDILVAGKTGTAQAAAFTYRKRDEKGQLVRDANGNVVREHLRLSTRENPNPDAPWYRGTGHSGTDRAHAWFIGYAPANDPKIAFAVLVEYGGGGGTAAAPIARDILQACVDAGYLEGKKSDSARGPAVSGGGGMTPTGPVSVGSGTPAVPVGGEVAGR